MASDKNTSIDINTNTRSKLVTAIEEVSTVADLITNKDMDICRTFDDTSTVTSAVPVGGGNLTLANSVSSTTSALNKNDMESAKQYTKFSIDSIIYERKNSTKGGSRPQQLISSIRPKSGKLIDETFESEKPRVQTRVCTTDYTPSDIVLTPELERQFNDYAFCDKSSEVKHPQTPLNKVPIQSHSPQLPEPAFVYPIQEESMSESMANDGYRVALPQMTSQNNRKIDNKNHSANQQNAIKFRRDDVSLKDLSRTTYLCEAAKKVPKCAMTRAKKKKTAAFVENPFTILNVPNVLLKSPPTKRRKLSKIDVAVLRRRERMQRRKESNKNDLDGFGNECSISDQSEDDSDYFGSDADDGKEIDLLIKSGPACKLELNPGKLEFLNIFRLTTHVGQNSIELQKIVRRKWISPDVEQEEGNTEIFPLNLPITSSFSLDVVENNDQKNNFLQSLGLGTVNIEVKKEMETIWPEVVKERLRRKCDSSLTKYYQKVFKTKTVENEKCIPLKCYRSEVSLALPILHRYENSCERQKEQTDKILQKLTNHIVETKKRNVDVTSETYSESNRNLILSLKSSKPFEMQQCKSLNSELNKLYVGPSKASKKSPGFENKRIDLHIMTHREYALGKDNVIKQNNKPEVDQQSMKDGKFAKESDLKSTAESGFSWPGLLEIQKAYEKYSKEQCREMTELKERAQVLSTETCKKQAEVKFLERKQRNMYTILSSTDRERKELLNIIDQLKYFIHCFR